MTNINRGIDKSNLERIESNMSDSNKGLWLSYLIPNYDLTEDMTCEVGDDYGTGYPPYRNIVFHNWFYISVNPDKFEERGFFYTEDEPQRIGYEGDSYDLDDLEVVSHNIYYRAPVELTGCLDEDLSNWLRSTCDEIGIVYDELESKLESRVLPDLVERGDEAFVKATMYRQVLPQ